MAKMFWEKDANPRALEGKRIAVIGYGSQGRAHALNLRDSKLNVVVGLRRGGPSWTQAEQDGWKLAAPSEASEGADVIVMLAPDMAQPAIYVNEIAPNLKEGAMLLFSHGFNIHYGQITPPKNIDVTMVAPKGPGNLVRRQYEAERGVPCLLAVHQDASGHAFDRTLAYAHAIGGTRPGVIQTTFSEETETDLFGEQAVLCGGAARPDSGRMGDSGGSGLPARIGVFRMPARAEADRRSDLRRRHRGNASSSSARPPSTAI